MELKNKPHIKGTKALFKNKFMEKLTRTHIAIPLTFFSIISTGLLIFGFKESHLTVLSAPLLFFEGLAFTHFYQDFWLAMLPTYGYIIWYTPSSHLRAFGRCCGCIMAFTTIKIRAMLLEFHRHSGIWYLELCQRNNYFSFFFFLASFLASLAFLFSCEAGSRVALNKKSLVPQKRLVINVANMGRLPGISGHYS